MVRVMVACMAALGLAGCGGGSPSDQRVAVVAGSYPLAWAAERIAGNDVRVINLTPPGAEPHDLELSPRDIERIEGAALVLYLGGGFQPSLEDAVKGHETALDLLSGGGAPAIDGRERVDPHIWLDPGRFAVAVEEIAEALGDRSRAADLVEELRALDRDYRSGLADCRRREIVASHAAFGHLADAYDLVQIALTGLAPEVEPGPRALERLVTEVRDSRATTVFYEPLVSRRLAEAVAREAGARTAPLDPLEGITEDRLARGHDYLSVMRDNLEALREALGCR